MIKVIQLVGFQFWILKHFAKLRILIFKTEINTYRSLKFILWCFWGCWYSCSIREKTVCWCSLEIQIVAKSKDVLETTYQKEIEKSSVSYYCIFQETEAINFSKYIWTTLGSVSIDEGQWRRWSLRSSLPRLGQSIVCLIYTWMIMSTGMTRSHVLSLKLIDINAKGDDLRLVLGN